MELLILRRRSLRPSAHLYLLRAGHVQPVHSPNLLPNLSLCSIRQPIRSHGLHTVRLTRAIHYPTEPVPICRCPRGRFTSQYGRTSSSQCSGCPANKVSFESQSHSFSLSLTLSTMTTFRVVDDVSIPITTATVLTIHA
jgi:hypothetical protein